MAKGITNVPIQIQNIQIMMNVVCIKKPQYADKCKNLTNYSNNFP